MARKWETVGEQHKCKRTAEQVNLIVPGRSVSKTELVVKDSGCDRVRVLEHVQAHVTLAASKRGDVQIFLVSPSGTRSNLVAKRPRDYSRAGFNDWPFMTVHMWGESPVGKWTLEIQNDGRSIAELKHWGLVFLGTSEQPNPNLMPFETHSATEEQEKPKAKKPTVPTNNNLLPNQADPLTLPGGANPGLPPPRLEFCAKQRSDDWYAATKIVKVFCKTHNFPHFEKGATSASKVTRSTLAAACRAARKKGTSWARPTGRTRAGSATTRARRAADQMTTR